MKKLLQYVPIITAALITINVIGLQSYYDVINVNIYSHVETAELLLSFIPELYSTANGFLPIALLIVVYGQMIQTKKLLKKNTLQSAENNENDEINTVDKKEHTPLLKSGINLLSMLSLIIIFSITIYLNNYVYSIDSKHIDGRITTHAINSLSLVLIYYLIIRSTDPNIIKKYLYILTVAVFAGFMGIYSTRLKLQGHKTILLNNADNISFVSNGELIKTDSSLIFYGETKDYIFLYNKADSSAMVYKRSDINSIKYKEGLNKKD